MSFELWKVRMVREFTGSSFEYELPRDWSEMLENIDMVDEAYRDSVFMGVMTHCMNQFGKAGFYPKDLISPKV